MRDGERDANELSGRVVPRLRLRSRSLLGSLPPGYLGCFFQGQRYSLVLVIFLLLPLHRYVWFSWEFSVI